MARKKPFRDLYRDGVTYSFLSKFLLDREQARLTYVEGWTTCGVSENLDFGSAYHYLLEQWAAKASAFRADQALDDWVQATAEERGLTGKELSKLQDIASLAMEVFQSYRTFWLNNNGHEYRYQYKCWEEEFKVPYAIEDRTVPLRGRFDAIFQTPHGLWLLENKTKTFIDEEGLQASLSQDLQTMLYMYAARTLYREEPKGVVYNVIRKPQHRQTAKERRTDFLKRVRTEIQKNPRKYFMRWEVTMAPGDLDAWEERTLRPLMRQVVLWWEEIKQNPFDPWSIPNRVHHFINPEGLYTRYGRSPFFEYLTRGSTYGIRKRKA